MRKLMAGLFYSIDGVAEAPNEWQFDSFDDELGAALGAVLASTDTVIMGRKGFEDWAGFWPNASFDGGFKDFINSVPKHIASRTLKGPLGWSNSSVIEGDLEAFVRDLKAKPGKDISAMGGMSVVRQLFLAGLLDELKLITHPVIAGAGKRHLFQPGDPTTRLELRDMYRTSKGNVVTTYALKG